MMNTIKTVGKIDEKGYLNGFTRRGYTPPKCLLELVANVLDAMDCIDDTDSINKKLVFEIQREVIKFIDNGVGMNEESAENMFAMHRENHKNNSRRGVSGIGAKPSLSILSNKTSVNIYTRMLGEDYLCITIPWDLIHKNGQYTGMIEVRNMNDNEKRAFIEEREKNDMLTVDDDVHGTTIIFNYNDTLSNIILANFESITSDSLTYPLTNPMDRVGIVFGRDTINIICKHYEKEDVILKMYDYFNGPQSEFYKGFSENTIQQWSKTTPSGDIHRFIWMRREEQWEFPVTCRGCSKEAQPLNKGLVGYQNVGDYNIRTGLRVDNNIFNCHSPIVITAENKITEYDEEYLGNNNGEFLSCYKLVRNNQLLGLIRPPDISISSARANGESYLKTKLVQCEVSFNPISEQNNQQDNVVGTQENKNQFNGDALPKNFTRLIKYIKDEKSKEVWEYFDSLIQRSNTPILATVSETTVKTPVSETTLEPPVSETTLEAPVSGIIGLMQSLAYVEPPVVVAVSEAAAELESPVAEAEAELESPVAEAEAELESPVALTVYVAEVAIEADVEIESPLAVAEAEAEVVNDAEVPTPAPALAPPPVQSPTPDEVLAAAGGVTHIPAHNRMTPKSEKACYALLVASLAKFNRERLEERFAQASDNTGTYTEMYGKIQDVLRFALFDSNSKSYI